MIIIAIYVAAALLPAILLLRYIYKRDVIEKESGGLLTALIFMGVLAALASIVLEGLGQKVLNALLTPGSRLYTIVLAFVVVAAVEEGMKLVFLKLKSWKSPEFNYRFDGVVYAVFVSLGFAAFENIGYVFGYGLSVALSRALLSVPAHMGFSVFMGSYYGRAKVCEAAGDLAGRDQNLRQGYLTAVALHGFYDACAMIGTTFLTMAFFAFVIIMYVVVINRVKHEMAGDAPIE